MAWAVRWLWKGQSQRIDLPTDWLTTQLLYVTASHSWCSSLGSSLFAILASLGAMLNRGGESHVTEAWELPSPATQLLEGRAGSGPGAYLGLFRSQSDPKAEMGFHMCVAILPSGNGKAPQIEVEELVQKPVQPKTPSASSHEPLVRISCSGLKPIFRYS